MSPNTSKTNRSNTRNDNSADRSRSDSKINLKLSKSRNRQLFDRSGTNNSKMSQYIKSVREMYDEQMNKMKLTTQSTRFYDHLKKVSH
jgi:phage replication-related protein YjqB (UPF0714/DUF867 family)